MAKKKLKLKGQNAKKLNKKSKKKKEETLARMQKTREEKGTILVSDIQTKLEWAKAERQKAKILIEKIKLQSVKLEGAITALEELLNNEKKENAN